MEKASSKSQPHKGKNMQYKAMTENIIKQLYVRENRSDGKASEF